MAKKRKPWTKRRTPKPIPQGEYMGVVGNQGSISVKKETWKQKIERLENEVSYLRSSRDSISADNDRYLSELNIHRQYKTIIEGILNKL